MSLRRICHFIAVRALETSGIIAFFCQAEDGIRVRTVTGVQTCALPIFDLDPTRVLFPRCLDMNDRQLRNIVTGLGGPKHGVPREDGFIITAASEVMAILCLTEEIGRASCRERE